jgi:hypothetical protein
MTPTSWFRFLGLRVPPAPLAVFSLVFCDCLSELCAPAAELLFAALVDAVGSFHQTGGYEGIAVQINAVPDSEPIRVVKTLRQTRNTLAWVAAALVLMRLANVAASAEVIRCGLGHGGHASFAVRLRA